MLLAVVQLTPSPISFTNLQRNPSCAHPSSSTSLKNSPLRSSPTWPRKIRSQPDDNNDATRLFLGCILLLLILLDLLLRLHGGVVDIPDQNALEDDGDQHNEEDGEEYWLVVEDRDGLLCCSYGTEPVELTHFFLNFISV